MDPNSGRVTRIELPGDLPPHCGTIVQTCRLSPTCHSLPYVTREETLGFPGQQLRNLGSTELTAGLMQWSHRSCISRTPSHESCALCKGFLASGPSLAHFFLPRSSRPLSDLRTLHVSSCLQPHANSVISCCRTYWFARLSLTRDSELMEANVCALSFSL